MKRRLLLLYVLCLPLATASRAAEFDPAAFPARPGAESAFREAVALGGGDPSGAAAALAALVGDPALPADAVRFALAELSPPGEASAHWEAIAADPSSPFLPEALARLAAGAEEAGRHGDAAKWLSRLEKSTDKEEERAEALSRRVAALDRAGSAEEAGREAIRLWTEYAHDPSSEGVEVYWEKNGSPPPDDEDRAARGKRLLDRGSRERAVEVLSALWTRIPAKERERRAEVGLALGKAYHFLRRYTESLPPLDAAAASGDPETEQSARFWRARSLFGLDRGNEGAPDLVRLADKYTRASRAPMWLLQAYRVFDGRHLSKEARDARDKLIKRYPGSDEAAELVWYEGWKLRAAGKPAEAAEVFGKSAKKLPAGWSHARALYWWGASLLEAGKAEEGKKRLGELTARYPVGFYTRMALSLLDPSIPARPADPRGKGLTPVAAPLPEAGELPSAGTGARAAAYLRLGYPEAARRTLAAVRGDAPETLRLLYWAEDFNALLSRAGCRWEKWPEKGEGAEACRIAYQPAFPASVARAAREADLHPHLLLAVAHTESHFDPDGFSPWEARGVMQFIPATAERMARRVGLASFRPEDLFDPGISFRLGGAYLAFLLDRFDGDVVSAVAAYNAGESAVAKWREKWPELSPAEFVESIPYRETRHYVKKVFTALDAYGREESRGLWPENSP